MIRKRTGWYLAVLVFVMFLIPLSCFAGGKKEKPSENKAAVQTEEKSDEKGTASAESERVEINAPADVAARVNGVDIPITKFDSQVQTVIQQYASQGVVLQDNDMAQVRSKVIDNLVGQELLFQDAVKKGMSVSDEEISSQMEAIKKQFKDDQEYENALNSQGITEEFLKEDLKMNLLLNKYIEQTFKPQVKVTDEDDAAFYGQNPQYFSQSEQIRASHILIQVKEDADDAAKAEARKKIETVQKRLSNGEEFSDLAREVSEGPSSTNGGDLGFFGRGQMVKPFEDAAFALKKGQISGIVETQFGYHLIKLTDKKEAGLVPYEKVKGQIHDHLFQTKLGNIIQEYIEKLKPDAEIEIFVS